MKTYVRKSMQKLGRSRKSFVDIHLNSKSEATRERAKYALDNFDKFSLKYYQKSIDPLIDEIGTDLEIALDVLQAWVNYQKGKSPRTIINYFSMIKKFFHYRGIKFHQDDIKNEINFPPLVEINRHGITKDEIKLLLDMANYKKKALYLCQLSSGLRIGELVRLRKKHLDLTTERIMVRWPHEFDKEHRDRITFFSKEAGKQLKPLLNKKNNEDLIFGTNEEWKKAKSAEISYLSTKIDKMGLDRYSTGIRKITTHSFRAYFITKVSRIDPNLAKLFAGQKGYLLSYDRPSEEELLKHYLKFESELLIYEDKETESSDTIQDLQGQIDFLYHEFKEKFNPEMYSRYKNWLESQKK